MSNKFTTYALTVRPRSGVTDNDISVLVRFIKKHCEYYYVITEKLSDERHIHAALFLKCSKTRSNVCTYVTRLYKHFDSEERNVLQKGVKILYSNSFLTEYMNKDDDTVVIERNLPELNVLDAYYPPKPISTDAKRRLNLHATMEQYESLWRTHVSSLTEVNTKTVRDFLFDMQYNERLIGLMDDKKLIQHSRWFTRWFHRAQACPDSFLPPFESEEGPGIHDTRAC